MKHLNHASSQTKNYEITFFYFYFRVTEGSYHSSLFLFFWRSKKSINQQYLSVECSSLFPNGNFGSKKDLRVFRDELRRQFCNVFFFLPIEVLSLKLTILNKKEEERISTLGERSTTKSCMLRSGRMNRSQKKE